MKKIKIMLTSIAVVAVVGGVFAFQAKKDGNKYCTAAFASGCNVPCTSTSPVTGKLNDGSGSSLCYTIVTDDDCTSTTCSTLATQFQVVGD